MAKKVQKNARMYDLTGLSRKCTLIKNLRSGTEAKFRPFDEALLFGKVFVCFQF